MNVKDLLAGSSKNPLLKLPLVYHLWRKGPDVMRAVWARSYATVLMMEKILSSMSAAALLTATVLLIGTHVVIYWVR